MKELSTEQKAKAYDEALEKARQLCAYPTSKPFISDLQELFPELAESEGERIRKALIKYLNTLDDDEIRYGVSFKDMCVWVEKQGEQILANSTKTCKDGQKPADKIEPKFKVGDWVVSDDKDVHDDYRVCKIVKIVDGRYYIKNGDFLSESSLALYDYRLWTIQDAKPGDVLTCLNDAGDRDVIFIFKNINSDEGWVFCFCAIDANGCFCTNNDYVGNDNSTNIHPATKEQCNQLEKAMTDAGYTFDFEKKELKKIEQKSAKWHREDEQNLNACLGYIPDEFLRRWLTDIIHVKYDKSVELPKGEDYGIDGLYAAVDILKKTLGKVDGYQSDDGILEHKCAISAVKKLYEQNPWSEEDEKLLALSLNNLTELKDRFGEEYGRTGDCIEWLKSLKDRYTWKPSDEQIEALDSATENCAYSEYQDCLRELIGQLKKLREE